MGIIARNDNVVVLVEKKDQKDGSLFLPQTAGGSEFGPKLRAGRVLSAGPGTDKYTVDCRIGERVIFPWDAGELCIVGDDIAPQSAPEFEVGTELRILRNAEIEMVVG